jgi:predicted O-linked N-acetylglucosamine transferase (SPINDLY family)
MPCAEINGGNLLDQAESLIHAQKYVDAENLCRSVLHRDVDNLEAHFLLGTSAYNQKNWVEASAHYRRSVVIAPDIGFLHANLALALLESGKYYEAQIALDNSIRLDGWTTISHYHQGLIFHRTERYEVARQQYEYVLSCDPQHIASWINLSAVLLDMGDADRAIEHCRLGLEVAPDNSALVGNFATAYGKEFRHDESLIQYQRLLTLTPHNEHAEVMGRMANILSSAWRIDECISYFNQAISVASTFEQKRALASTRLFVLHYPAAWTPEMITREHLVWGETYFQPAPPRLFTNPPDTNRRLRIAYISPDLRIHAVVFFLQPVLIAHDPEMVEIYCYSDVKKPDEVTMQLREKHGVVWRDISVLDDDAVQRIILSDQIDILVDLAGHSSGNRLSLFARRVAPVQVNWIGYPNTTGLNEMDYRITDPKADPPGMTEKLHSEELVRLPDSFLCYRPGSDFPPENPLPMFVNRFVTFGSFSNFIKVTPDLLDMWARILGAVPNSRLFFRARGMTDARFQQDILPIFERHGVNSERITILGHARSVIDNLRDYHNLDIALDTFPYHGTTTTCESLYMGVPVITLAGRSHVSRVGVSLLQSVGIPDLIAETADDYVSAAIALANDLRRLLDLRKSLRGMVLASPLTDNITFTRHLEAAYRLMWQRWCADQYKLNLA